MLGGAERFELAVERQPLERVHLDLADALTRQPELLADLLERFRLRVAVEAKAQLEHVLLPVRELRNSANRPARVLFVTRTG